MSDEGKTLQPEHVFKKFIWRSTLDSGEALERFTTWTVGGIAAIVGLMISNLDSIARIASVSGIRTSILLFSLSLLAGAASKQFGMAVTSGISRLRRTEDLLESEAGQTLMDQMTTAPRDIVREVAEPFLWPLSSLVLRGGERGLTDYVAADKRFVKMFCLQLGFNLLHTVLAIAALFSIAFSI
jgi:hypothetical protein